MSASLLPLHPGLSSTTRLRPLATDATAATIRDWVLLALFGVLAACSSTFLDLGIKRIPGHAILRVVFPMALGLALVPRSGAGSVMGGTAALTAVALQLAGFRGEALGLGACTSLIATGPLLDWTLRRAHNGWRQYVAFALAGVASNLLALAVRGAAKALGWEAAGRRPLVEWLTQAVGTYIACGLIAGLISGAILFSLRPRRDEHPLPDQPS
jgi:hypothetical protein